MWARIDLGYGALTDLPLLEIAVQRLQCRECSQPCRFRTQNAWPQPQPVKTRVFQRCDIAIAEATFGTDHQHAAGFAEL